MDPVPEMVIPSMEIKTPCAARKGVIKVSSIDEISALVKQLMLARTALITAQAAIEGVLKARADMAAEPEPEAAAAPADPAAIPTADGQHVTCPACGFRDGRHNPAGCRRLEQLERIGEQVTRLSEPEPASPEAVAALADSIADGTPLVVTDDEPKPAPLCDSDMPLPNGGTLKCTLDDYHDGAHSAIAGERRWLGTGMAARTEDGERIAKPPRPVLEVVHAGEPARFYECCEHCDPRFQHGPHRIQCDFPGCERGPATAAAVSS